MSFGQWIKYDLPRLLRFRPTPFELALGVGALLFLGVLGLIGWGMLPSSSLDRYESSIGAKLRAADHFPERRADLPEGSRFYRAMHGSLLVLYTPATPADVEALLEGAVLKFEKSDRVLRDMGSYVYEVVPGGFDLDREGAVWGRVSPPPWLGVVWCDPSTGEIIYFARTE